MAAIQTKAQVHAIVGTDDAEVKRTARELAERLTPDGGSDFARDIIDGAVQYADEAATRIHATIEALLTFPFFGGDKLVWLKSASFLADDQLGRSLAVLDALEQLAGTLNGGLPPSTRFLLSAVGVDKRRSFYKSLAKLAKVEVFDKVDPSKSGWEDEAAALIQREAAERGLTLSAEASELFVLFTGGERRVIENELEKLDLYLGPSRRQVSADAVRLLVPLSRAGIVFELGNAIAERNLSRALRLLEQLLFQGETPIGIMYAAIIPTVRNLLLVKDLMTRHRLARPAQPFFFGKTLERLPAEAIAHLPRKKDGGLNAYPLGVAASHAHRYEIAELRSALEACLATNVHLVTSTLEVNVALSQLLVRIVAPGSRS
ncbi:MAG: polymerase subunit delta [Chthoniobacter sp.]|jgi:DNA polymerase-3 subunit delta|nr:polymerase subunit delta [Chthoniobacter sp.]